MPIYGFMERDDERPWGGFVRWDMPQSGTVKVITVSPGEALSYQYHNERDEYWYILDRGLKVILDGEYSATEPGDEIVVRRRVKHRVINTNMNRQARFLELVLGPFDEDDIVRLDDRYGRS